MSYSRKTLTAFSAALGALYAAPPDAVSAARFRSDDTPLSEDEAYLVRLFSDHVAACLNHHGREATDATNTTPVGVGPDEFLRLRTWGLTPRECEVVFWIAQGKRDAEISGILGCAPKTVSKHVENLLAKLGVETRLAAVCAAQERLQQQG
jgi:DNA-binding CsgD family transcriptional regulator